MGQVLVLQENSWYQAIASLKNYYEINIEDRIHKYAENIFAEFHCFKFKYSLNNRANEICEADLILIAKDFSKWIIVEVEMSGKGLSHTKKQLRVFTSPIIDNIKLTKFVIEKDPSLSTYQGELHALFTQPPNVLVIFDSSAEKEIDELRALFKIDYCSFQIYRTNNHDLELYRINGGYPYVSAAFSLLKRKKPSYEIYDIEKEHVIDGIDYIEATYKLKVIKISVLRTSKDVCIKIPSNPFPPEKILTLTKTLDKRYIIDIIS